jgi:hypothetical protein
MDLMLVMDKALARHGVRMNQSSILHPMQEISLVLHQGNFHDRCEVCEILKIRFMVVFLEGRNFLLNHQ